VSEVLHSIQTSKDVEFFLDSVNGLHDGHLVGVEYIHNGLTGGNPNFINPELTELHIRYMVTSIQNKIVELVFSALSEWQIRDNSFDITDTAITLCENKQIIWADDYSTEPDIREVGSYVIAKKMKWRFLN
jgi:hypothetical protein